MNNDLISVIIPVFNVEDYLSDCVESVINQSFKNIEVILVNDGSSDESGKICDSYALKDNRIKVYHKVNGGLSDARNYGINKSTGNYIYLIDSDDFLVREDVLELLYNSLKNNDAQISVAKYLEYYHEKAISKDNDENTFFLLDSEKVNSKDNDENVFLLLDSEQAIFSMYNYKSYKTNFIVSWNKLYERSLFNHIVFPYGKLHEDEFTTYKLYLKANQIILLNIETYAYRQREGSIMNSNYSLKRLDALEALEERMEVLSSKNIDILDTQYNYLILLSFNLYMLGKNEYNDIYYSIKAKFNNLYAEVNDTYTFKRKVKLFILRYFNGFYYKYIIRV